MIDDSCAGSGSEECGRELVEFLLDSGADPNQAEDGETAVVIASAAGHDAMLALFGVAFGLSGLGLMIAWTMDSTSGFHAIMNLLLMPMWLLSGAVFPVGDAHSFIKAFMYINPLTYGVSAFRHGLYLNAESPPVPAAPMTACASRCSK